MSLVDDHEFEEFSVENLWKFTSTTLTVTISESLNSVLHFGKEELNVLNNF